MFRSSDHPQGARIVHTLLKLHVKIVNTSLYLLVMWQHIVCLCMRCFQCRRVCRHMHIPLH